MAADTHSFHVALNHSGVSIPSVKLGSELFDRFLSVELPSKPTNGLKRHLVSSGPFQRVDVAEGGGGGGLAAIPVSSVL